MVRVHSPVGPAGPAGDALVDLDLPVPAVEITLDDVHQFLELLDAGDVDAVTRFALDARATGASLEAIMTDLLGGAQALVGTRWQHNVWTAEQEHAATMLVEAALAALVAPAPRPPLAEDRLGEVVVGAADGDEHLLAPRMLSELLRARGRRVTFVGSSASPEHFERRLEEIAPVAVAISTSVSFGLLGVHRSIVAAHGLGLPVVVGGNGFGDVPDRARALGADAYAADASAAIEVIDRWERRPPRLRATPDVPAEARALDAAAGALARQVLRALPPLPRGVDPLLHDAYVVQAGTEQLLRCVANALLVRDDRVLFEFVDWLADALVVRGVTREQLARLLGVAVRALGDDLPVSRRLLQTATEHVRRRAPADAISA